MVPAQLAKRAQISKPDSAWGERQAGQGLKHYVLPSANHFQHSLLTPTGMIAEANQKSWDAVVGRVEGYDSAECQASWQPLARESGLRPVSPARYEDHHLVLYIHLAHSF